MSDTPIYYIRNSDQNRFRLIYDTASEATLESPVGNTITVTTEKLCADFTKISGEQHPKIYPTKITAAGIMQDAIDTMVELGKAYDSANQNATCTPEHPAPIERSMGKVVKMFNDLTGHTLIEEEGWDFMILLKLVRASNGYKADNFVDGAAYFSLAGECAAREGREKN